MIDKDKKARKKKIGFIGVLLKIFGHPLSFLVLLGSFFPLLKLYWDSRPPFGADFYQATTYFSYYKNFLTWPHLAWKYIWYNGLPALLDYPWLHSYLALPLTNFFNFAETNKVYSLATLFLFFLFCYLLFWELSKSRILSIFITAALVWSRSIYVPLFFGGTTAFAASMFLAPLSFYLMVKYFRVKDRRWLLLSGFFAGLSVIGHLALGILFVVIPLFLILFFYYYSKEEGLFILKKFKDLVILLIMVFGIALISFYPYLSATIASIFGLESEISIYTSSWPRANALKDLLDFSSPVLPLAAVISFLLILVRRNLKKYAKAVLPFVFLLIYIFLFELMMFMGKNPFSETLGADRAYWFFPLVLGALTSVGWYYLKNSRKEKSQKKRSSLVFVLQGLIIAILALNILRLPEVYWFLKEKSGRARVMPIMENFLFDSQEENKPKIVPQWIDVDEKNYRFYTTGQSIWWNTYFQKPLTRGYADPQKAQSKSWGYWLDTTVSMESVEHFDTPLVVAENNAYFLLDWYAVKHLDGNLGSPYQAAPYIFDNEKIIKREGTVEGSNLYFFELKDEVTSPILKPTNVPTVLIISSQEAYNSVLRVLAQENLNSNYIIPIHGSKIIDDVTKFDLENFDAVYLYDYKYKKERNFKSFPEKPWQALKKYVKDGGNLFIDTGSEVKESDIENFTKSGLPEIFPVSKTERDDLGTTWQLKGDSSVLSGVDVSQFSELIYQDNPWKLSFSSPDDLKSGAKLLLAQKDKAVVVVNEVGEGKVVWSGLNFPYHIKSYNNFSEGQLFKNILREVVKLEEEKLLDFEIEREKSEKIILEGSDFKGILFKENNYGGWKATVEGQNGVKALSAGPDFMYFSLKEKVGSNTTVNIEYKGRTVFWFFGLLSYALTFYIAIYLIFGLRLSQVIIKLFRVDRLKKGASSWWARDDD